MITKQEIIKHGEFQKKFRYLHLKHDEGIYKNVRVDYLLITSKERKDLIRKSYNRAKLYNNKYKPKEWAGHADKDGKEL